MSVSPPSRRRVKRDRPAQQLPGQPPRRRPASRPASWRCPGRCAHHGGVEPDPGHRRRTRSRRPWKVHAPVPAAEPGRQRDIHGRGNSERPGCQVRRAWPGTIASGTDVPASASAHARTVPSPPTQKTSSAPAWSAPRASPAPGSARDVSITRGGPQPCAAAARSHRTLSTSSPRTRVGVYHHGRDPARSRLIHWHRLGHSPSSLLPRLPRQSQIALGWPSPSRDARISGRRRPDRTPPARSPDHGPIMARNERARHAVELMRIGLGETARPSRLQRPRDQRGAPMRRTKSASVTATPETGTPETRTPDTSTPR